MGCSRDDCRARQQDAHRERQDERRRPRQRLDHLDVLRDHLDGSPGHPLAKGDHRVVAEWGDH
jgi:hypothetical protein